MLYESGTLRAATHAERHFARATVQRALRSFENKTAYLVTAIINQLQPRTAAHYTSEQLLEVIDTHPCLAPETNILQRYCAAFPELHQTTARQRRRVWQQAHQRLQEALEPHQQARRFACAKGYC